MRFILTSFLLLFTLSINAETIHPKRLLVKMKKGKDIPYSPLIKKSKLLFGQLYLIDTSDSIQAKKELLQNKNIEYIEHDYRGEKRDLPQVKKFVKSIPLAPSETFNDPKVSKIWSFRPATRHGVSVEKAYNEIATSPREEIIVAVVDTGVDFTHEDLKEIMWVNEGEIAANGIDDDGNGYIDDVYGINTLVRDSEGRATGDMKDTHSHGTHVSGTIGAQQNNNIGIAGIASKVKIMGIRTVPNTSDETDVDVIEAFLYAARNGAKIINCSFGKDKNEGGLAVQETIDHIGQEYGVLVVAAAGNSSRNIDRRPTYPASFISENLLVVASTSKRGGFSYFSNFGVKGVDVAAPGSSIYSTVPGGYGSMSGTSMASPTTAGVAAQILSHHPELTPYQLKKALMENVTPLKKYRGKLSSGGRIDLYRTLKALE
jgi:thermitase